MATSVLFTNFMYQWLLFVIYVNISQLLARDVLGRQTRAEESDSDGMITFVIRKQVSRFQDRI